MGGLGSSGPGGLRQHHARLLSGGGVDVVAEENLRSRSARSAVLGHVVDTDVDCGGGLHLMMPRNFLRLKQHSRSSTFMLRTGAIRKRV